MRWVQRSESTPGFRSCQVSAASLLQGDAGRACAGPRRPWTPESALASRAESPWSAASLAVSRRRSTFSRPCRRGSHRPRCRSCRFSVAGTAQRGGGMSAERRRGAASWEDAHWCRPVRSGPPSDSDGGESERWYIMREKHTHVLRICAVLRTRQVGDAAGLAGTAAGLSGVDRLPQFLARVQPACA